MASEAAKRAIRAVKESEWFGPPRRTESAYEEWEAKAADIIDRETHLKELVACLHLVADNHCGLDPCMELKARMEAKRLLALIEKGQDDAD